MRSVLLFRCALPYHFTARNRAAMLKYSRARAAGSGAAIKSRATATQSAPAVYTSLARSRVIPPMATNGLRVNSRACWSISTPTTAIVLCFRGSLENGSERDVIGISQIGRAHLIQLCVEMPTQNSDDFERSPLSRNISRAALTLIVVLAYVNSSRTGQDRDICPIVYDEAHSSPLQALAIDAKCRAHPAAVNLLLRYWTTRPRLPPSSPQSSASAPRRPRPASRIAYSRGNARRGYTGYLLARKLCRRRNVRGNAYRIAAA